MEPTNETVCIRAVQIAARIMQAAGLCRHESPMQCRHSFEYNVNDWGSAFCPDCGQKLDWTMETEEEEPGEEAEA